jgi:adenylate cyclase
MKTIAVPGAPSFAVSRRTGQDAPVSGPGTTPARAGWIDTVVARLARIGADPRDDADLRQKKSLLVLIAALILPVSGVWGALYVGFGSWAGITAFIYFAVSLGSLVVFARTGRFRLFLVTQLVDILLSPTAGQMFVGGFLPSGGVALWAILAPLGALVFLEVRRAIRWFVAFVLIVLLTGVAGELFFLDAGFPPWFPSTMLALNIVGAGAISFTLLASFAKQRNEALAALRVEQERSELLLVNILPRSIADRLKSAHQTIADHFDAASIVFADVVNFTPFAQRLSPAEVVGILDDLFSHFDTLVERHGLEKIKTIGDAYMAAAGVPDPSPRHARMAARLALEMREAIATSAVGGGSGLELRIGINSGPLIAGVIGSKRFLYDLWGDAVNTASRMESQGMPGEIQITRATYELLKDEFVCRRRGTIEVKGKGQMETWYLVGPRSDEGRTDPSAISETPEPSQSPA